MGAVARVHEGALPLRREDLLDLITQIVENIPNMVFVKDAQHLRFVLFNRAGEQLLGYSRDDMIGKNDYDFFPREQADFFTAKDREVLERGETLDIAEEPIETPHGRRWLHTKKVPLLAEDGTPRYLLGISEDITERRKIEQMKDDLLSIASHELRSPTSAMLGTLNLLEATVGPQLDDRSRRTLALAKENGARMIELIENCLDLGRLEEEQLRLHMRDLDLGQIARQAVRLNQPFADGFEVRFEIGDVPSSAPVQADPERLMQALTNVMTNAAKFSPAGGAVGVFVTADEERCSVAVQDRGPGIPESFRERVFEKFSRARTEESAGREGAGLGLRIARQLVERMGGRIGFETETGEGTTFTISFPRA